MDENQSDEFWVTIKFDDGNKVKLNKSFLMNYSLYFDAMFSGNFVESQSGHQVQLKDIDYRGFMSVINSLKQNYIIFDSVEDLLLILETSQFLQFTRVIEKSIDLIKIRYLFTTAHVFQIFLLASKLGLKSLFDNARNYILFNFKMFLTHCSDSFYKTNEYDLLLLLNDSRLNIENESNVYNLVVDWCKYTNRYDLEYKLATSCVRFNIMNTNQLKDCISKTNDLNLQNFIKKYLNYTKQSLECVIRPVRNIPNVLCAVKNEGEGTYIYCWDWDILRFTRYIKVEPLPAHTTGYIVTVKGMDIFVMAGEISYGRGTYNKAIWCYNLFTKQWKKFKKIFLYDRCHGIGHFCGDVLYLLGGSGMHQLQNEEIERFRLKNDIFIRERCYAVLNVEKYIDRLAYCSLEYKNRLILISKSKNPTWLELSVDTSGPPNYNWTTSTINLKATVVCAIAYHDNVYILAYNKNYSIVLTRYCPMDQSCKKLKCFKTKYKYRSTMCTFNVNKAMVFGDNMLELYCIDNSILTEYTIQLDSFHSNHFFSVPHY